MPKLPSIDNKSATSAKGSKVSSTSQDSAMMAAMPAESADGRMGADIQLLIEDITDYRDLLVKHNGEDQANLKALDAEIEILEYRQQKIESRLEKRQTAKTEYERTLADTEKAFNQIVNTANAVASILKPPKQAELNAMDAPKGV